MKRLVLSALLVIGMNVSASASAGGVYPSGPSNLLPANVNANTLLWVGGDVAKGLFDGMTKAPTVTEGFSIARLGENLSCIHNTFSQDVEYSCVVTIEMATGRAVIR